MTVLDASTDLDALAVTTIRTLCIDAVQAANSGIRDADGDGAGGLHAVAAVPALRPRRPDLAESRSVRAVGWARLDLLYSLLHLTKVAAVNPAYETLGTPSVTLDDIRRFRQADSKCPGHPEYRWTSGVEATTGPWYRPGDVRRHGDREPLAGGDVQPPGLRDV